jgi:hypothetical protein
MRFLMSLFGMSQQAGPRHPSCPHEPESSWNGTAAALRCQPAAPGTSPFDTLPLNFRLETPPAAAPRLPGRPPRAGRVA